MPPLSLSPYQRHCKKWENCKNCDLYQYRQQVVFGRGKIPADVVLVGEGPGKSEDSLGSAFVGPAGDKLDEMITDSMPVDENGKPRLRLFFTNVVACVPWDEEERNTRRPEPTEVQACQDRLIEVVKIANPKLVICVGKTANDWLDKRFVGVTLDRDYPMVHVEHPSAVLQAKEAQKGLLQKRITVGLRDAFHKLLKGEFPAPSQWPVERLKSRGRYTPPKDDEIPF